MDDQPQPQFQPPPPPQAPEPSLDPQPSLVQPLVDQTPYSPTPAAPPQPQYQVPNPGYQPQPLLAANQPTPPAINPASNPGLIVLQWLTYAFWGWTVLTMSVLVATVLANFVASTNDGNFMPYAISAILVLLPISVACDHFYSKQEPAKKTGAASVVMVIHAVLFALFGIGALITFVVSLVQLFTSSSSSNSIHVALYSSVIITLLYAAVFLRTLNFVKLKWFNRFFIVSMVVVVGIFSVLAIVGPVATARLTRNDSLIDANLPIIQSNIDDYVTSNNKLPPSLADLSLNGDVQKLVADNLVQYTPNSKPLNTILPSSSTQASNTYYYELCVDYKKSSGSDGGNPYSAATANNDYTGSAATYNHPAGNYCYKGSSTTD